MATRSSLGERAKAFYQADGNPMAELLNWLVPLDDDLIVCKDGSLLAAFTMAGLDLDSTSPEKMNAVRGQLLYAASQLQEVGVVVGWVVHRRRTTDYPVAEFPDPHTARLDQSLRESFISNRQYVNSHSLYLNLLPSSQSDSTAQRIGDAIDSGTSVFSKLARVVKVLRDGVLGSTEFAYESLTDFSPLAERFRRVISEFVSSTAELNVVQLRGAALGGYLASCASLTRQPGPVELSQEDYLDGTLCSDWVDHSRRDYLQMQGNGDPLYATAYTLRLKNRRDLKLSVFDDLMAAPFELVLSQVFKALPSAKGAKAVAVMKNYHDTRKYSIKAWIVAAANRGNFEGAEVNKVHAEDAQQAQDLKDQVAVGKIGTGMWFGSLLVLADSVAGMQEDCKGAEKLLQAQRLMPIRETLHKLSNFCSAIPGSYNQVARWSQITTENFVDLSPIRTVSHGDRINQHLTEQSGQECPCLLVLPTQFRTPFYFTGYKGDLGHLLILGPAGVGKTTFINLGFSEFRKYPFARGIGFDRDYSMRPTILLQGGSYIDLSPEKQAQDGRGRLAPLRALLAGGDMSHLGWCVGWCETLASSWGYQITAQDHIDLERALAQIVDMGRDKPSLLSLATLVVTLDQTKPLAQNLLPWTRGHVNGSYFDNDEDDLNIEDLTGIESGSLLQNLELSTAFLEYAFYRISVMLRADMAARGGRLPPPTLIVVPEVIHFMRNKFFLGKLEEMLTTLRKLNAILWMDTQSPDRLIESEAYSAFRDNLATVVFGPNERVLSASLGGKLRDEFMLSDQELRFIAGGVRKRDFLVKQDGLTRRISLGLSPQIMAYLRSDKKAQQLLSHHFASGQADWRDHYLNDINRS